MSDRVAIFIPTFGRSQRIESLWENLRATTSADYRLYFIVEQRDADTIEAVGRVDADMIINPGPSTYASCINSAYTQTDEPFFFTGGDDVKFRPNWLTNALQCMTDPRIGVVGTKDPMHDSCDHSTHSLVRRKYIEERSGCLDFPNTVLFPYWHGWVDHEFLGIAKTRGAYLYCEESLVEHHHPGWDWLGRVKSDDKKFDSTYAKGNRNHLEDTAMFVKRSSQWIDLLPDNSPANRAIKSFVRRNRGVRGRIRYGVESLRTSIRLGSVRHILDAIRSTAKTGTGKGDGAN